jgi:hypothetical protein
MIPRKEDIAWGLTATIISVGFLSVAREEDNFNLFFFPFPKSLAHGVNADVFKIHNRNIEKKDHHTHTIYTYCIYYCVVAKAHIQYS